MSKIRMCMNAECVACKKQIAYKKPDDKHCVKCGGELIYMCKNCKEVELSEEAGAYCTECQEKLDEKRYKVIDKLKKVGVFVGTFGVVIAAVARIISDLIKGHKKAKKMLDKVDPDRKKLRKAQAKVKKIRKKIQKKKDKI